MKKMGITIHYRFLTAVNGVSKSAKSGSELCEDDRDDDEEENEEYDIVDEARIKDSKKSSV